ATQAAIWHFTDGFELAGQGDDPVIAANYEAILAAVAAGVLPTFGEPGVSLDIEAPGTTEATAGEPIGPYAVRTTAGEVTLTASPRARPGRRPRRRSGPTSRARPPARSR